MTYKPLDHLDALESQTIYILREAFNKVENLAMLWSLGKDSNAMLWMARKAFFGHVPFPLVHVDTTFKIPEMIEFRDQLAKDWNLNLVVGSNEDALKSGMNPEKGRVECCTALKTQGLKQVVAEHGFTGLIAGIRRDEEGTRAKERVFSPRGENAAWDFRDQPPEFWEQDGNRYLALHPPRRHSPAVALLRQRRHPLPFARLRALHRLHHQHGIDFGRDYRRTGSDPRARARRAGPGPGIGRRLRAASRRRIYVR